MVCSLDSEPLPAPLRDRLTNNLLRRGNIALYNARHDLFSQVGTENAGVKRWGVKLNVKLCPSVFCLRAVHSQRLSTQIYAAGANLSTAGFTDLRNGGGVLSQRRAGNLIR